MPDESAVMQQPTVAEHDGWEISSSSSEHATSDQLAERLGAGAVDSQEPASPPLDPVVEDHTDEPVEVKATPTKKLSASERKQQLQAEINALTRQRHDALRARDEAIAARSQRLPEPAPAPVASVPVKPTWAAFEADGKSWDEYQDAHDSWVTDQIEHRAHAAADQRIAAERGRFHQETHEQARVQRHEDRIARSRTTHADFDEVIRSLDAVPQTDFLRDVIVDHEQGSEILYYLGQHPDEAEALASLPMTRPMMDAVQDSPNPQGLLSLFAQHPDEHARIARLPAHRQLLALGVLNARLDGANTGSPSVVSISHAKPPLRPPGGSRPAGDRSADDLEFGPEYIRKMNAEEHALRRRRLA